MDPQRRDHELVERSQFPLAGDRLRRDGNARDRDDDRNQRGQGEPHVIEAGIVPVGDARTTEPSRHARPQLRPIFGRDAAHIAGHELRGIGLAPVEYDAERRASSRRYARIEIGLDDQRSDHLLVVDRPFEVGVRLQAHEIAELRAARDALDELGGMDAVRPVEHRDIDILDVERGRGGKDQQLDERGQDQHDPGLGVANERPDLLDDHRAKPGEAGQAHGSRLRRVARKQRKKKKKPKPSMIAMLGRITAQTSPAMNTVCSAGMR